MAEAADGPATIDVDAYLARIDYDGPRHVDRATLDALHLAHLRTVPFENLDVYQQIPVTTDRTHSVAKIVDRHRGGWCFELNGAFGGLLTALGFQVRNLAAAVQLGGPTDVVDHLCLEVVLDEPLLVDVGFGDGFVQPLSLNRTGPQDGGGGGPYELVPSPKGTTLTRVVDGVAAPQYRFTRVARDLADFDGPSRRLQDDTSLSWHRRAMASRLLDTGTDRVTLAANTLKITRGSGSAVTETDVPDDAWSATLAHHFAMTVELDRPPVAAGTDGS